MKRARRRIKGRKTYRAVRPNVGLERAYQRMLERMIDDMARSVRLNLRAVYGANKPAIAQDDTPAARLKKAVDDMADRWEENFDNAAPWLADWFATRVEDRSDRALAAILRAGGFSVKLRQTAASRDILQATVQANVALIKSIPSQYFTQIEGMVMRSVQTGRDLQQLTNDLQREYGVTRRRAELIARDQNAKATSAMQRARQIELGIKKCVWIHSHAGKEPRPTHVKMDGETYDPAKGMYDPAEKANIWPGQLINCRCVARAVVPGFE